MALWLFEVIGFGEVLEQGRTDTGNLQKTFQFCCHGRGLVGFLHDQQGKAGGRINGGIGMQQRLRLPGKHPAGELHQFALDNGHAAGHEFDRQPDPDMNITDLVQVPGVIQVEVTGEQAFQPFPVGRLE